MIVIKPGAPGCDVRMLPLCYAPLPLAVPCLSLLSTCGGVTLQLASWVVVLAKLLVVVWLHYVTK